MKKLFLLVSLLFCFSQVYGQVLTNTTTSVRSIVGMESQIENPKPAAVVRSGNAANSNGYELFKESKFTANLDLIPFTLLNSMGGRQVNTGSFILGATWKLDQHWQGVVQYANLETKSIDDVEYLSTHYLGGIGFRWYLADGIQASTNFGAGSSEIKRKSKDGDSKITGLETPVWMEAKVLWMSDNTGYGVKIHVLDVPNKAEREEDLKNYGHVVVMFSVDVGFSGIAGLVQ